MKNTLRLILGDQLNRNHSWFNEKDTSITYVFMEMKQETDYVKHHIQKILGFFASMRAFADELKQQGHQVMYLHLDDPENQQDLANNIHQLVEKNGFEHFAYQLPDEYRLDEQLSEICHSLDIETEAVDTEHFLTDRGFIKKFFEGKKTYLMETFYRHMRKELGILMETEKDPAEGKWNFDVENRKSYDGKVPVPAPIREQHNLSVIYEMLSEMEVETFGRVDAKKYAWPISRKEALSWLDAFIDTFLPHFGTYEDAMETDHPALFHSRLSLALNTKMLQPLEVVKKVEQAWQENSDQISISQVEGFIRQIIGWREFMRGVYWAHMPDYAHRNFFNHQRKLPEFYWTGDTKMACLSDSINNSFDNAWAHHIQRLMVTGNFALLAGIDPNNVDAWYLGVYIDAIEWVEITNTRGMSQFADGGLVGTKPYVSSANYIDKMSNYCKGCHYSKTKKYGDKACPFNSLYWHFYERNRDKLEKNPRIGMAYRTLDRMNADKREKMLKQAEEYLDNLDKL